MAKLVLILIAALVFEAIGVVFLSKGLKQLTEVKIVTPSAVLRIVREGATNPNILLGVFFEAVFFAGLLILMSKGDVSFVWPLTSLGFVLTTLTAQFILHEKVSLTRWAGVFLIMSGAAIITWTEKTKERAQPEPTAPSTRQPGL